MAKTKGQKTLVRKAGITQKTHNKKRQSLSSGGTLMNLIVASSYQSAANTTVPIVQIRRLGTPTQQQANASRMAQVAHVTRSA